MTHFPHQTSGRRVNLSLCRWLCTLLLVLLPAVSLRADAPATALHISRPVADTEGLTTLQLDWTASSNATYLVQSATDLSSGGAWTTRDAVRPPDQAGSCTVRLVVTDSTGRSSSPAEFYRLILPQPQIFSVEPAIITPGSTNDFYVIGQCFPTNAVLRINDVTQAGAVVVSSSLATVPGFVPDVPGTYRVSLVVGGAVMSFFNVVCADPLANPELVLQGPPTEPPASPGAFWLSKKGYDYWKARSDMASASPETEALSDSYVNRKLSKMAYFGPSETGKGINQPGLKRGIDPVSAAFETQEGKKGLNAVNVKLASNLGSSGQDGVEVKWKRGSNLGSSGQDGVSAEWEKWEGVLNLGSSGQDGVSLFSGEVQACVVDLAIPGRELDFVWARTYHSRLGRSHAPNGWTFSYDVSCAQNGAGGIDVFDGTGRKDTFTLGTNGTYTCPQLFREGTLSNNTFTLTFADTGHWVFNPFDGTASAGLVHQVITRNGSTITLSHNATSGRLEQVVDDLGRTNTVAYDTSGRLLSVTDFSGRTVTYHYYTGLPSDKGGSAGDLKSVTSPPVTGTPDGNDFPDGKTTSYTYTSGYPLALDRQNHLLLSSVDALGQTTVQFSYDLSATSESYLRCTTSQCGANPPTVCSYAHQVHLPWFRCAVNDPVGNVTECDFDSRGRCVAERDFTGRATPGTLVTNALTQLSGKLRDSDPDYFETQWTWNNDSLCTSETSPGGQQVRCVYQSDFDPATPARKRADCRVVRELASSPVDLDGDGVADTSERVSRFDYDPRFGSDPTPAYHAVKTKGTGANSGIVDDSSAALAIDRLGRPAINTALNADLIVPSGNGVAIKTKGTGAANNRAVTFGREKLKATTKTQGDFNLSNRRKGWDGSIKGNIARKGWDGSIKGNVRFDVSEIDPRGNVTTGSYDPNGNLTSASSGAGAGKITFNPFSITRKIDCAYDTHGQLTAITNAPDANGRRRVDSFTWSQGQMTQCVVDAGAGGLALTSAFEYDARGNLTRCVDPGTNDWLFTYNSLDQLVQSSSATLSLCFCKIEYKYDYDANDNLVRCSTVVLDPAGNAQGTCADNYRYDSLQRLTECALAVDPSHVITNRYVYDANSRCVQVLGPDAVSGADPHQMTTFEYDERGLLFRTISAPGSGLDRTNELSYTPQGEFKELFEKIDAAIKKKSIAYDGFSRPAGSTDPMGNITTFNYDANDNLKVVRSFGELHDVAGSAGNVRLAESRYEYDSLDRCAVIHELHFDPATQSPIGDGEATTRMIRCPSGACVSVTDDLGQVTTLGYDTAGRSTSAISAGAIAGIVVGVVVARDACGNVTSVTETNTSTSGGPAQVFASTYAYDALGRRVRCTDSAGNTSSCAYDSLGHVVRATDAMGNDTTFAYDFMGDCLASVSYAGSASLQPATVLRSSSATYDANLRCASATDANGNTTSCAYDTLGNCTVVSCPDGTYQQLVWSPRSNLIQSTDANGTVSVCTYDLNDRLIHRDITMAAAGGGGTGGAGGGGAVYVEAFSFDGCDRLVSHHDDDCDGAFAYDSLGSCIRETLNGLTTSSSYDAVGNRLSLAYPGGRVLTYAYDVASRCTGITESGAPLASFAYTGSRLSQETCGNGVRTQVGYDGLVGTPNATNDYGFGQVSRVRHALVANSSVFSDCKFTYDLKQNKTARTVAIPGAGGRTNEMLFAYDAVDQLVQSAVLDGTTVLRNTTYGLDHMGNRTNVTGAAACSGDYTLHTGDAPFDLFMNRYTTTPCEARSYDDNGNLLSRSSSAGLALYAYDYADRLVQVQDTSTGALAPVASYTYDALGRRATKTVYAGGKPTTRQYFYDGTCAIEERQNGAVAASFVLQDCALVGMRLGAQDYFVHTDDQGNTLALTGANGNVVERYDCDDYGAVTFLTPDGTPTSATSSAVGNPYCWGGLRLDAETGLQNDDGGGYLDPLSGRPLEASAKTSGLKTKPEIIEWRDGGGSGLAAPGGGNNPWSGGPSVDMKTGVVKFFNEAKGFGFIKEDGGQEVAKHYITIPHNLQNKVKALGANGEGKKEFVGHVSLLK